MVVYWYVVVGCGVWFNRKFAMTDGLWFEPHSVVFPGVFIWSCIPWFFQIQYAGHWVRSWEFHTLELHDDTYRDPLIPPVDVWTNQNRHFIEEVKIRKERFQQQQERLNG